MRIAWGFAVAALLWAVSSVVQAAGVTEEFRAEAVAIRQDRAALDEAWHRLLARLPAKGGDPETLDVTLAGAVAGKDLRLRLYRTGGRTVRARAWAPAWNDMEHAVVHDGLRLSGTRESGELAGTIHVRLEFDGWVPMEGQAWDAWFEVNGKVQDGAVKGRFGTTVPEDAVGRIPPAKGSVAGSLTRVAGAPTGPADLPTPRIKGWSAYQAYADGRLTVQCAENLYQWVRGMAIAMGSGLAYADALHRVVPPRPFYEDYDPPKLAKEKKREKSGTAPSLDDLGGDAAGAGDLGGEGRPASGASAEAVAEKDPATPGALAAMRAMRKRTATLLDLVKAWEASGQGAPAFRLMDSADPGDPLFHPWYETRQGLASDTDKAHVLPAGAGGEGPQNWAPIRHWRVMGPFPVADWYAFAKTDFRGEAMPDIAWDTLVPRLPEVVADAASRFRPDPFPGGRGGTRYKGPAVLAWEPMGPYDAFGIVGPPFRSNRSSGYIGGQARLAPGATGGFDGADFGAYLAEADVKADADAELWVAFGMHARGALWLNDELVWAGPSDWRRNWLLDNRAGQPDLRAEYVAMLKLPFRKGINRLRVRNEVGFASQHFWLRLCTQGKPGDPAAAAARERTVAEAKKGLASAAAPAFGFRGDGSGLFDAQPPVAWNLKRRQNVAWYTPLPFWGNSSPVLAGDRVFVMVEYDRLYCLSKADGKILWERPCNGIDTLPEPDRAKGHALYERWWATLKKRNEIPPHLVRPDAWLDRAHLYYWNEANVKVAAKERRKREATPELLALQKKREELENSPDPVAVQAELSKVLEQIEKLNAKADAGDPEVMAAQAVREEYGKAYRDLLGFLGKNLGVGGLDGYWQDYDGYQFSTPVTDGKRVWVKAGFGALSCFDLDGNRQYVVRHGGHGGGSATISSPLLVDGKIVMKLSRPKGDERRGRWETVAFDAETGKELWAAPCRATGWGACSPVAMRLTNGRESMAVIVNDAGAVFRADDGKVLVSALGALSDTAGLAVQDDVVVFTGAPPMAAFRLTMMDRDTVGHRPLWRRGDSAQYGSACFADGLVFTHQSARGAGVDNGPGEKWAGLRRFRAEDGYELDVLPLFRKAGNCWSIPSVSRGYVYHYAGDNIFNGAGNKQPMTLAVVERGAEGDLVAINAVERSYSAAVMEADRLYMRGYHGVWCVAYTGDEGRAFEARHVAETLLDQVAERRPKPVEPVDAGPARGGFVRAKTRLDNGQAPASWYFAGPYPAAAPPSIRTECLEGKFWADRGAQATGTDWKLVPLDKRNVRGVGAESWLVDGDSFTLIDRQRRRVVDFLRVVEPRPDSVYYLYAELESTKDRVVRLELGHAGLKAWINGVPVADGARVRLKSGGAVLLVEVAIGKDVPSGSFEISPRFWHSDDPAQEEQEWLRFVSRHRSRLQAAVDRAANNPEGRRAAAVLAQM